MLIVWFKFACLGSARCKCFYGSHHLFSHIVQWSIPHNLPNFLSLSFPFLVDMPKLALSMVVDATFFGRCMYA